MISTLVGSPAKGSHKILSRKAVPGGVDLSVPRTAPSLLISDFCHSCGAQFWVSSALLAVFLLEHTSERIYFLPQGLV